MECIKCNNKPYVGKIESLANERSNNHRKDAKKSNSIPVDAHYLTPGHDFNKHTRFTLIEQIRKKNLCKQDMTKLLKEREHFWIKKLNTLAPDGFNQELK